MDSIDFPVDEMFELCVLDNSEKYEFLINIKPDCDKLLVLGSSALVRAKKYDRTKPVYNRWSWEYDDSTIFYNDPTLYLSDEMTGTWGVGNEDTYYLENIKDILLKILNKINIKTENTVFYGSSMGGFMSIQLATMMKGSTAIADVPQLDLTHYDEEHRELLRKHCFSDKSWDYIKKNYYYRLSVTEMMKREKYIPNAVLNLDFSVNKDVDDQYINFFIELNKLPFSEMEKNYIKIAITGKEGVHRPLDEEDTLDLIHGVLNKDWMIYLNQIQDSRLYKENESLKNKLNSILSSKSSESKSIVKKIFKR